MKVENFDHLFEQSLGNFEVEPRLEIWEKIEKKILRKRRRSQFFWWLFGSGLLFISAILLCKYLEAIPKKAVEHQLTNPTLMNLPKSSGQEDVDTNNPLDSVKKINPIVTERRVIKKETENTKNIVKKKFYPSRSKTYPTDLSKRSLAAFPEIEISDSLILLNNKEVIPLKKKKKATTKSKKTEKKKFKKLWYIQPSLGILNNRTFNDFSSFDDRLNGSPIERTTTFSYGIRLRWQLNLRWSLQSGVFFQRIQYNTKDIRVFSGGSFGNLTNVNSSGNTFLFQRNSDDPNTILSNPSVTLLSENATLQQQFEYVEFPFEVTYAFYKSGNIDLGVTGGLSYLYLNENMINVKSTEISDLVGEAINLNDRNISSNIGLDFVYKLNDRWAFNVSSAAKFHLKTFSKNSTGFTQYSVGFYTGVLYKF